MPVVVVCKWLCFAICATTTNTNWQCHDCVFETHCLLILPFISQAIKPGEDDDDEEEEEEEEEEEDDEEE